MEHTQQTGALAPSSRPAPTTPTPSARPAHLLLALTAKLLTNMVLISGCSVDHNRLPDSARPMTKKVWASGFAPYDYTPGNVDFFGTPMPNVLQSMGVSNVNNSYAWETAMPGCTGDTNPLLNLYTYVKPYQLKPSLYPGLLPAKATAVNGYTGDMMCPYNTSDISKSFGYYMSYDTRTFGIDNSVNPWRWNAPVDIINHVEMPSMFYMRTNSSSLDANLKGTGPNVILDYDLVVTIKDHRAALNENSLWDVTTMGAADIWGQTAQLAYDYGQSNGLYNYFLTRHVQPSIQISLATFLREDGSVFLEQEFMLASKNYASSNLSASSNVAVNPFIFEGGTNPASSWYRLRADVAGQNYWPIPDGHSVQRLHGSINLTSFYATANANNYFPGQNGNFNALYGENNPITRYGVIFEAIGPWAVTIQVNNLTLRTQ